MCCDVGFLNVFCFTRNIYHGQGQPSPSPPFQLKSFCPLSSGLWPGLVYITFPKFLRVPGWLIVHVVPSLSCEMSHLIFVILHLSHYPPAGAGPCGNSCISGQQTSIISQYVRIPPPPPPPPPSYRNIHKFSK